MQKTNRLTWLYLNFLILLMPSFVLAKWVNVEQNVTVSSTLPAFDRVNRQYISVVEISNQGETAIAGPLRLIVIDATIPLSNLTGITEQGLPYLEMSADTIQPDQSVSVQLNFELQRKRLSFTANLQQDNPNAGVYAQAEGGDASVLVMLGGAFNVIEGDPSYVTISETDTNAPSDDSRVIELNVTFPQAGSYEMYARVRVGPNGANDDSFYAPDALGANNGWVSVNSISGFIVPGEVGYEPGVNVVGGGSSATEVWKWMRLSDPIYTVPDNELLQTFRFGGREDGLDIDKFAFAPQGVLFTIEELENGLPGQVIPPPPPFVPEGPPMADGQDKFVGGVCCGRQRPNFEAYFNQVTPENAGKWGSAEPVRDSFNWTELDEAYNLAKNNGYLYKHHVLIWGNQQPAWITDLPVQEQLEEILEWMNAINQRYAAIDFIEVVNEFDNDPPDSENNGPGYIDALRLYQPATTTELISYFEQQGLSNADAILKAAEYDWIINSFQMARRIFPASTRLMINEYSVINTATRTDKMIELVDLLQQRNLIDDVGFQGHAFSTTGPNQAMQDNLDRLAAQTGLDLYVTELDIDGATDLIQLLDYQRIFPLFWEHPAVKGITLWGYLPGHWRENQGAILAQENGAEKPALVWLRGYVRGLLPQIINPGLLEVEPGTAVGTSVATLSSIAYDGNPHAPNEQISWSILGGSGDSLFAIDQYSGQITVTGSLNPALHNLYIQVKAGQYTSTLLNLQILVPGDELEPIVIEYNFYNDVEGWRGDYGTPSTVGYDGANLAVILIPDWSVSSQNYIKEISATDLTNATLEYQFNVTQAQVDGGLTVQAYVQTGAPNYSRIYAAVETPVAGTNTIVFNPVDNDASDLQIIERIAFQLNGVPTEGELDNVLLERVRITIPVTVPPSNIVEYDFVSSAEGWRGDYGTDATVGHDPDNEAAVMLPNGVSNGHNYIKEISATDFTNSTVQYTLSVSQQLADSGMTVQGYIQTGAPNYTRIYGGLETLSSGANVFTFSAQDNANGDIAIIERVCLQINGEFSGVDAQEVLLDNVTISFP
ncbi:endo-1,4-beta-xylanase [Aliiglaciecola sp. LCG003]|uniref:endo-1,4-beta-xylanase n=1 Tax=Aliiglaciecola sp. LCG003 TaxID=3053655 RepID=UPI002573DF96|nr:endo-1,4-beta-xylanase [Aliiglaciecola sp. LCG003]WJG11206.1 endo-1,4-beta-xylanase [Aliiglaciecola sp. LCG003]